MNKSIILIGAIVILSALAAVDASASYMMGSGWGMPLSMGANAYNSYDSYSIYYRSYRPNNYAMVNNYLNNRNMMDFADNRLDRTYDFIDYNNYRRYDFPSNSYDYNTPRPYGFYEYRPYASNYQMGYFW